MTKEDILDEFDWFLDFWPPICRHIESQETDWGSDQTRTLAIETIRATQDRLHERLFGQDEDAATDVISYTVWELRRQAIWREIATMVPKHADLLTIWRDWQTVYNQTSDKSSPKLVAAIGTQIEGTVGRLRLSTRRFVPGWCNWPATRRLASIGSTRLRRFVCSSRCIRKPTMMRPASY